MPQLQQLLAYLGRDDVDEVRLETGTPVSISQGGRMRPLTRHTITADQVHQVVRGTELEPLLPKGDAEGSPELVVIDGETYIVMIARDQGRLQIRFGRPPSAASSAPPPTASAPEWVPPGSSPSGVGLPTQGPMESAGPRAPEPSSAEPSSVPRRGPGSRQPRPGPRSWTADTSMASRPAPSPDGADAEASPAPPKRPSRSRPRLGTMPESDSQWQSLERFSPAVSPRPAHPVTSPEPAAGWSGSPSASSGGPAVEEAAPMSTGERRAVDELSGLLRLGRSHGASDVHVTAGRPMALRVGGRLAPHGEPLGTAAVQGMLDAIVPTRHAMQLQQRGYCDFAIDVPDAGRFRVNVARQRTGLKGCFRAVVTTPPSLEQLGLPAELAVLTRHHQGLAIVSGPSGHGKTTTMAALVDLLNASRPVHIISVEDPVEVLHPRKRAVVSQREVGTHTRSFSAALRAALREDPDVIVIGELRDRETVEMAMSAAETGHLVIATMSTPSGAKTISRLIDMFPPDDQAQVRATLAGALKIVVSQRLVPRADGRGLVAAAELITGNVPLWSLIRDDKLYQLPSLLQRGRAFGMIRIEDSLLALVRAGVITEDEARRHADDPQGLRPVEAPPPEAPGAGWRGGIRGFFDKGGG